MRSETTNYESETETETDETTTHEAEAKYGRPGEEPEDAEARRRGAFLVRHHDIRENIARAVVYRELGYTHSGIAKKMGVTEGTARRWMKNIAEEYGDRAVETKWREQRTGGLDE